MIKRFAVFSWVNASACGGWDDYRVSFDTFEEAESFVMAQSGQYDWSQVVDLQTGVVREARPKRFTNAFTFSSQ